MSHFPQTSSDKALHFFRSKTYIPYLLLKQREINPALNMIEAGFPTQFTEELSGTLALATLSAQVCIA